MSRPRGRAEWPESAPDRLTSWLSDRVHGFVSMVMGDYYDPDLVPVLVLGWAMTQVGLLFDSWLLVGLGALIVGMAAWTAWRLEQRWRAEGDQRWVAQEGEP